MRALFPASAPGEVKPEVWAKEEVAFQIVEKREKEVKEEEEARERKKKVTKDLKVKFVSMFFLF